MIAAVASAVVGVDAAVAAGVVAAAVVVGVDPSVAFWVEISQRLNIRIFCFWNAKAKIKI